MKKEKNNKFSRIVDWLYQKLFKINDTPQKIALGLGLGVFAGIFPGTGAVASLFLAILFRANRASALLGSLLTNTWLSIITLFLAIKAGALMFGIQWQDIYNNRASLVKNFSWLSLFELSTVKVFFPILIGFILISFCFGLLVYLVSLAVIIKVRGVNKKEGEVGSK